jgi:predicted Rossmann-fold nucleotide-binding protein
VVSAFYGINRVGRPSSEYLNWLRTTFQINNPFIFFTQAKFKNDILELIPLNRSVLIVFLELEDSPYYKDIDRVKQIIDTAQYKSRIFNIRIESSAQTRSTRW